MREDEVYCAEEAASGFPNHEKFLIDLGNNNDGFNNSPGAPYSGSGGGGFAAPMGYGPPPLPSTQPIGFNVPSDNSHFMHPMAPIPGSSPNCPPPPHYDSVIGGEGNSKSVNIPSNNQKVVDNKPNAGKPTPAPRSNAKDDSIPELPSVPAFNLPDIPNDDDDIPPKDDSIDFDDLTKRFEELKKRK